MTDFSFYSYSSGIFVTFKKLYGKEYDLRGCIGYLRPITLDQIEDYAINRYLWLLWFILTILVLSMTLVLIPSPSMRSLSWTAPSLFSTILKRARSGINGLYLLFLHDDLHRSVLTASSSLSRETTTTTITAPPSCLRLLRSKVFFMSKTVTT